jgi:hypothetical protein
MTTTALAGLLTLALIVRWAVHIGYRYATVGQQQDHVVRDAAVCAEAERGERGLFMDWHLA